jgi:hypothetical protein
MFSFEECPDIETVPNVSEFLGNTFNIWDNDRALLHCRSRNSIVGIATGYVLDGRGSECESR